MGKDPAFLFYPNDYIGGTMGMTFEEKGAYIELLMLQFNRGHMTIHMIGHAIGQLWDNIQDKFKVDENGLYYNARLDLEISNRKNYVQSRHNNRSGVNQYTKKEVTESGHMTNHTTGRMEDVNENEDVNVINVMEVNKPTPKPPRKPKEKSPPFVTSQHLSMTEEEYNKLVTAYGKEETDRKIEYSRNYAPLKKKVSLYLTINDWLRADVGKVDEKKTGSTPRKTLSGGYQM